MTAFLQKLLRVTFKLTSGNATFANGTNTLVLTQIRIAANTTGAVQFLTQCDLQLYGMLQQDMNSLSVLRGPVSSPAALSFSTVLLEANAGDGNWVTIFSGNIIEAGPEYRGMPEVFFHCQAITNGYVQGLAPTDALSYPDGAQVHDVAGTIADSMGLILQNHGVSASVQPGSYFPGAPKDQLERLHQNSGQFDWATDPTTLAIVPTNQPRTQKAGIVLTPDSGLIGYPTIESLGIGVVALFNPLFLISSQFTIADSDVVGANGDWIPYRVQHQLDSLKFGGQWFTSMQCIQVAP